MLFFHGNAGNLQNRIYKLNDISKLDLNYLIIAYRGFSGNKGEPNEIGLYKDSEAAKKWLNDIGVSDKDIILYGRIKLCLCQIHQYHLAIFLLPQNLCKDQFHLAHPYYH